MQVFLAGATGALGRPSSGEDQMPPPSAARAATEGNPDRLSWQDFLHAVDQLRQTCCCAAPLAMVRPARIATATARPAGDAAAPHSAEPLLPIRSRRFVLPGVHVIDGGTARSPTCDLFVAEGAIDALETAGTRPSPPGYDYLREYRGCHVSSALVDMHAHLPPHNVLRLTRLFLLLQLAHGVTSLRDAGDIDGTAVPAAQALLASGALPGPRLRYAGPFVTAGPPRWQNSLIVRDPSDAPDVITELQRRGCTWIKLYENLTIPMLRALQAEAARAGIGAMGHVPTPLGIEEALLPDAQHFFGVPPPGSLRRDHVVNRAIDWHAVDAARIDVVVRASRQHRLAHTPTLVASSQLRGYEDYAAATRQAAAQLLPRFYREIVWHPREGLPAYRDLSANDLARLGDAFDRKLALVRRLHEEGVELRLGTDVQQPFVVPGAALHQEMRLFVAAGVPTERVWSLATDAAAEALGLHDLGALRAGRSADLLVLRCNPLTDTWSADDLEAVCAAGALCTKPALDAAITAELTRYEGWLGRHVTRWLARLAMRRAARAFVG